MWPRVEEAYDDAWHALSKNVTQHGAKKLCQVLKGVFLTPFHTL